MCHEGKDGYRVSALRPTEALVDPDSTDSLPANVVACSGLDLLSHALESYTAGPYNSPRRHAAVKSAADEPGANPWSDLGSREAMRLLGAI